MKHQLELVSLSSTDVDLETWVPESIEDIFISLDIEVGYSDGSPGTNMFYATLTTKQGLLARKIHDTTALKIIQHPMTPFNFSFIKGEIISLLKRCSRNSWDESCQELNKYLSWEYEDYHPEKC
jgi:hypothetical protein